MIHEHENREDLEIHLKQNGKKFSQQCVVLMREMYKGRKLNSMIVEREFLYNSRRLRDCREHRPDIVKSRWEVDNDGKTKYMLYWIEISKPSTKTQTVEKALRYIKGTKNASDFAKDLLNSCNKLKQLPLL